MGLITIVSSSSTSATSLLSPVGLGIGGAFVAAALIIILAYYDILDASDFVDTSTQDYGEVKLSLIVTILPLLFTFGAVVTFKAVEII